MEVPLPVHSWGMPALPELLPASPLGKVVTAPAAAFPVMSSTPEVVKVLSSSSSLFSSWGER